MKVNQNLNKQGGIKVVLYLLLFLVTLIVTIPLIPLNSDYSYVIDSLKTSDLGTYRWFDLCNPTGPMTKELDCVYFYTEIDDIEYQVYLLNYSTLLKTWKARYYVNSLNKRMGGLHFEAFTYKTLLVSFYPSDPHALKELRQVVYDSHR